MLVNKNVCCKYISKKEKKIDEITKNNKQSNTNQANERIKHIIMKKNLENTKMEHVKQSNLGEQLISGEGGHGAK